MQHPDSVKTNNNNHSVVVDDDGEDTKLHSESDPIFQPVNHQQQQQPLNHSAGGSPGQHQTSTSWTQSSLTRNDSNFSEASTATTATKTPLHGAANSLQQQQHGPNVILPPGIFASNSALGQPTQTTSLSGAGGSQQQRRQSSTTSILAPPLHNAAIPQLSTDGFVHIDNNPNSTTTNTGGALTGSQITTASDFTTSFSNNASNSTIVCVPKQPPSLTMEDNELSTANTTQQNNPFVVVQSSPMQTLSTSGAGSDLTTSNPVTPSSGRGSLQQPQFLPMQCVHPPTSGGGALLQPQPVQALPSPTLQPQGPVVLPVYPEIKLSQLELPPPPESAHIALQGVLPFVPFPEGDWSPETMAAQQAQQPVFPPPPAVRSMFIGHVPVDASALLIAAIIRSLSGVAVTAMERTGKGCFVADTHSLRDTGVLCMLHRRILFDRAGVWVANTADQLISLRRYVNSDAFRRNRDTLPKGPMVLERSDRAPPHPNPNGPTTVSTTPLLQLAHQHAFSIGAPIPPPPPGTNTGEAVPSSTSQQSHNNNNNNHHHKDSMNHHHHHQSAPHRGGSHQLYQQQHQQQQFSAHHHHHLPHQHQQTMLMHHFNNNTNTSGSGSGPGGMMMMPSAPVMVMPTGGGNQQQQFVVMQQPNNNNAPLPQYFPHQQQQQQPMVMMMPPQAQHQQHHHHHQAPPPQYAQTVLRQQQQQQQHQSAAHQFIVTGSSNPSSHHTSGAGRASNSSSFGGGGQQ